MTSEVVASCCFDKNHQPFQISTGLPPTASEAFTANEELLSEACSFSVNFVYYVEIVLYLEQLYTVGLVLVCNHRVCLNQFPSSLGGESAYHVHVHGPWFTTLWDTDNSISSDMTKFFTL